jgi:outer membrane biosynthesis protein TonB
MRIGLTISTVLHALVLCWALFNFAPRPLEAAPRDSLPVDIISSTEFSQMTAGTPDAPKAPTPKPLVEKVGDRKPSENPAPKVVEKPEIVATASTPPPPEAKPEVKKEPERKKSEPKPDPIAEALKKEEAKKPEPKKEEAKTPAPAKKPEQAKPQPKFDPNKIAALLDKRDPQRQAATGDVISHTPSLGTARGNAPMLTQSELDALRAQISRCWNVPAGAADARNLQVEINIKLRVDGSLSAEPMVLAHSSGPYFQVFAESALTALRRCQPYTLPAAKYDVWKDIDVVFDPKEMFGG